MFGSSGMVELVDHVRLRRPEAPRERDELRRRDVLRAQREHLVLVERALDLGERAVVQVPRDVEAPALRRRIPPTAVSIPAWRSPPRSGPVRARAPADGHAAPGGE